MRIHKFWPAESMKLSMATPDSLLPLLCLCCFLLPVSVACPGPFYCNEPKEPLEVKLGDEWFLVEKIIHQNDNGLIIIVRYLGLVAEICMQYPPSHSCRDCLESGGQCDGECSVSEPKNIDSNSIITVPCPWPFKCKEPKPPEQPVMFQLGNGWFIVEKIYQNDNQHIITVRDSNLTAEIYMQYPSHSCLECLNYGEGQCEGKCSAREHQKIDSKFIIIGVVAIGSVGVIIIGLIVILLRNKRRYKALGSQNQSRSIESDNTHSRTNQSDNTHSNAILESRNIYFGVPVFSYDELEEATNKFDQSKELGSGGFGIVYHGKLKDGREVAVKRLFERNYKRVQQFINEVKILTRLRHRNLVSLYGCTSRASQELLLVYEYIPNGTLGSHLHGNLAKPGSLPWSVRMRIAIETANALSYIHACGIIHRDVKSSNLLLDHHFCVKVADFGISRLFSKLVSHVSTCPAGSPGYLDPEYYQFCQLTEKSDVYSFGVVLIELISSKPAIFTRATDKINLANMAVKKIQRSAFSELVDPSLGFESDDKVREMIISVAKLAFRCLQRDVELRPSMGEVMEFLQKIENGNYDLKHLEFHGAGFPNRENYTSLPTSVHRDGDSSLNNLEPQHPSRTV